MAEPRQEAADASLVQRSLRASGWHGPFRVVTRLAGGGSGSRVFLLELGGERAVLKVTEDPRWHGRAIQELAVYQEFAAGLTGFLPVVRAAHRDRHTVRLLLTAYEPYPTPLALTDQAWVELAGQLGRLHSVPIPRPTWLRHRRWPSTEEVANARRLWNGYGFASLASRAAGKLAAAKDVPAGLGDALTHGDCHVGNLLRGPAGRTLWADWQEVCLSSGLDDLVFLWQRAEFDGAHPPRGAMISAYASARSLLSDSNLRSDLAACELRLLFVAWPSFLAYGGEDRQQILTRRLEQLVDERFGW